MEHSSDSPVFHWGRANGWAALSLTELLSVLPEDHPQRAEVMKIYKSFMNGLAKQQSSTGMWYQLLDRHDTYLESSATAMFIYAIARGVDRGWLDPFKFGPVAMLGWNGLSTYVNERGQIENVCIATDMGADYAFYYYRPYNVSASHGFGPVLLAAAEMTRMLKEKSFQNSFGTVQYLEPGYVSPFNRGGRGARGGRGGRGND
jgi:rhamnogalacturonyl hydrolase YesR